MQENESIKLKDHEKNYTTHDLEIATIVHALKMWRNYLMERKFELGTYQYGLKYCFDQPTLNARQAIWLEFLCEFYFEIQHMKGKKTKWLMHSMGRCMKCMWHLSIC